MAVPTHKPTAARVGKKKGFEKKHFNYGRWTRPLLRSGDGYRAGQDQLKMIARLRGWWEESEKLAGFQLP